MKKWDLRKPHRQKGCGLAYGLGAIGGDSKAYITTGLSTHKDGFTCLEEPDEPAKNPMARKAMAHLIGCREGSGGEIPGGSDRRGSKRGTNGGYDEVSNAEVPELPEV